MAARKPKHGRDEVLVRWSAVPKATVLNVTEICDGHTILKPEALRERGVPGSLVDRLTMTFKSDRRDPKTTLFNDEGEIVDEVRGVYSLVVLEDICRDLGVKAQDKIGRGSQAAACRTAIIAFYAKLPMRQLIEGDVASKRAAKGVV